MFPSKVPEATGNVEQGVNWLTAFQASDPNLPIGGHS